jgi:hypothetical protein
LITRWASVCETFESTTVRSSSICSGVTVFGSQSAKSGLIHFQVRGQSSRLCCSLVHTTPFALRSSSLSFMARS